VVEDLGEEPSGYDLIVLHRHGFLSSPMGERRLRSSWCH
jgi:hypothetical protein